MRLWSMCNEGRRALAWLLVGVAMLRPGLLLADDALSGTLEVRSAYVNVENDVVELHARIQYPENEQIRAALQDGVSLQFDVEVNVSRERRLWFDSEVAAVQLRRELAYHTVSDRYVVRDTRSGEQENFPTLDAALDYLGTIDGWPVVVAPQLNPNNSYRLSVRAGIRRGRMPDTLRTVMFWTDDWHRTSAWYSWSLPQ